MPLDVNLSPLYRINGQEQTEMPGVLALTPPRNAARGREQDRLLVYLLLTGNSTVTLSEYHKLAEDAANVFYQTPRAVTSALRASADFINKTLLDRNMSTTGRGQYALAWLTMAALRENQCIFSLSGPLHAYWFSTNGTRHYFEPGIAGKGLGSSQTVNIHYAQSDLTSGDLMLFCGRLPNAWSAPLENARPSSFDSMRRRLVTLTTEDLNAVLMQTVDGVGAVNLFKGAPPPKEEPHPQEEVPPPPPSNLPRVEEVDPTPGHVVQPSAYSIPAQHEDVPAPQTQTDPLANLPHRTTPRDFPASIPRAMPKPQSIQEEPVEEETTTEEEVMEEVSTPAQPAPPREPSARTRQTAKAIVNVMQGSRRMSANFGERFRRFIPRLLPSSEPTDSTSPSSSTLMLFLAVLIPLMVVTILSVVYLRYGRNEQYDAYLGQANQMKQQALSLTNPVEQRKAWENVLLNVDRAEEHRQTNDTINLRKEAETHLDGLLGITRMQFNPAFSAKLGIEVSRMAASEKDLYLLNAVNGEVLRAIPSGSGGFELDTTFICKQGIYGNYTVGPIVDILALPIVNLLDATVLGIDAGGNLIYCAPGKVPQASPLPPPDTNWGHITGFMLDGGNLYVLDAPSRAVWVYVGKDGTYVDRPYFFFGEQTPSQDVIDFVVSGDEMYLLHADGHITNCSYSRIDTNTSKCVDPVQLVNPFAAYQDTDLFGGAHFTQILFAAAPDPSILLLDSDGQSVMRFAPRTLELQNQFRPTTGSVNPIPQGSIGAVAVGPDHVLYLAVNGQVYFAVNMP